VTVTYDTGYDLSQLTGGLRREFWVASEIDLRSAQHRTEVSFDTCSLVDCKVTNGSVFNSKVLKVFLDYAVLTKTKQIEKRFDHEYRRY